MDSRISAASDPVSRDLDCIRKDLKLQPKNRVFISEVLDVEQQQNLVSSFTEFDIVFNSRVKHPHPYASASRKLELLLLLDRIGYVAGSLPLEGYDDVVCDIGGEFSRHVLAGRTGVHSCCPVLDTRDGVREVTRFEHLNRVLGSSSLLDSFSPGSKELLGSFLRRDPTVFPGFYCNKKSQDCSRTARVGISLHSAYDLSLKDFAAIMLKKNMYEIYGSFIFSDLVLIQDSGTIEGVDCFFSIDKNNGSIEFSFKNDPSIVYTHSLKNYMSLVSLNSFIIGKVTFVVELLENRSGVQFFKIVRVDKNSFVPKLRRYLWLPSLAGKTRVRYFDIDYDAFAAGDFQKAFVPVSFLVDSAIVDKVVAHAYASTESKFRPVEIFNFLLAYNGRVFFGSDVCVRNKPLPAHEAMLLANAIYLDVFVKKYDLGKINQILISAIKHNRELSEKSLLGKFFKGFFSPPCVLGTEHSTSRFVRFFSQSMHSLLYWWKRSPLGAYEFLQENTGLIRCDTNVVPLRFSVVDKRNIVSGVHELPVSSVLVSDCSFDIRLVVSDILSEFYSCDKTVVSLSDLVPSVLDASDKSFDDDFRPVFAGVLEELSRIPVVGSISDSLSSFRSCFESSLVDCKSPFCFENFVSSKCSLVITLRDLSLVVCVAEKVDKVFLYGFDLSLFDLIPPNLKKKITFLSVDEDDFVKGAVSSVRSLCVFDVFVSDDFASFNRSIISLLNIVNSSQRFFFLITPRLQLSTLFYLFCHINYVSRGFSCNFHRRFFQCSSVPQFDLVKITPVLRSFVFDLTCYLKTSAFGSEMPGDPVVDEISASDSRSCCGSVGDSGAIPMPDVPKTGKTDGSPVVTPLSSPVSSSSAFVSVSTASSLSAVSCRSVSSSSVSSVCSFYSSVVTNTCLDVPRDDVVVFENKNVVIKQLPVAFRGPIDSFTSSLDFAKSTIRRSARNGPRNEWLFGPIDYKYDGIVTKSLSSSLPVALDGIYDRGHFNTLLVVFYPENTTGLAFHKDNEPEMASESVLTFSSGNDCTLHLKYGQDVKDFELSVNQYYLLRDQSDVLHAVTTKGARFALTFRRFQTRSVSPLSSIILPCSCDFIPDFDLPDRMLSTLDKETFERTRAVFDPCKDLHVTVCRSEFKLLEFSSFFKGKTALDLCASPGGFTYVLRMFGFHVTSLVNVGTSLRTPTEILLETSIFDFKPDSKFDFIVADGSPEDGFETDFDKTFALIERELEVILAVMHKDSRALIKLILHPRVSKILDKLSSFKLFAVLRPVVTRGISREFYVIFGDGGGGCGGGSKFLHPLLHHRVASAFGFLDVVAGKSFVFGKIPVPVSKFICKMPGDGSCLFHSLVGGAPGFTGDGEKLRAFIRDNRPDKIDSVAYDVNFVQEECLPGAHAGIPTVLAFCELFFSHVKIITPSGSLLFDYSVAKPFYELTLVFANIHYDRLVPCPVVEESRCSFAFNFNRINLGVLLTHLDGCFPGADKFELFGDVLSPRVFYNASRNRCLNAKCFCLDGTRDVLGKCVAGKVDHLVLMLPVDFDMVPLGSVFEKHRVCAKFFVLPGFSNLGFIFVLISFKEKFVEPLNVGCFDDLCTHVSTCGGCAKNTIVTPPLFNHVTNTFFFCHSGGQDTVFVNDFSGAAVVFKLVPFNKEKSDVFLVGEKFVRVPVRLQSVGVLSTNAGNLKKLRQNFKNFFSSYGAVSCVGIENCGLLRLEEICGMIRPFACKILIKSAAVGSLSNGVDFAPRFVPSSGDESFIVNALVESREYYRAGLNSIVSTLLPLHKQYLRILSDPVAFKSLTDMTNNKADYGLLDMTKGVFRIPPKDGGGPYQFAFDGDKLVDISSAFRISRFNRDDFPASKVGVWLKPGVFSGFFSVSKDTKLVNSAKIFERLSAFDIDKQLRCKIRLIEGVPGCGKTFHIIENHKFSLTDTEHIVLTSSREAAEDLRRRVAKKFSCSVDSFIIKRRYRTVDSFLMHYSSRDYCVDTIWLDEGLMKHFGDVLWCALISNCNNLNIIGDRAQIPFVNRLAGVTLHYSKISLSSARLERQFLSVTHRCPRDVAVLLQRMGVYSGKVFSSSVVHRSLQHRVISSASELIMGLGECQLLTFSQAEKHELSRLTGRKVFTINEFQGNQARKIVLVRTNPKDLSIFSDISYILVGISRHTHEFLYATVVKDKCLEVVSKVVTQTEIASVAVKGGGVCLPYKIYGDPIIRDRLLGGGLIMGKHSTKQFPFFRATPRAATMIDLLKQDSKIRDFVQNNTGVGVVPLRVNIDPIEMEMPDLPKCPPFYVSDPLVTMQFFFDILMPGNSTLDNYYDDKLFAQDDLYFATKEMLRFTEFERFGGKKFDGLTPCLRTSCPTPISNSLKHVLKAFYDRNGNVPVLQGVVDDERMADNMFDSFVECYVGDRDLFATFVENPVTVNVDSVEDWLFTQPTAVRDTAFEQEFWSIFGRELNSYSFILKKLPKPKLDPSAFAKYPSPQTIAHHPKDVNAVFCPLVRECKQRLLSVLRDNTVIFSDMSVENFEKLLTFRLPPAKLKDFKFLLEVDMAKYDKSQNRLALLFEIKLLRALGFPDHLLPTWIIMHVYTRLYDHFNKLSARVFYQRKSGDPMTFFGNTIFLMAVVAVVLAPYCFSKLIKNFDIFCLFSGDDLLIFLKIFLDISDLTHELANIFNLESKILNFRTPYFCSKFLIMTPWGQWVVVPDVLKLLIKLGRHDLVNSAHVDEYRISCYDVGKHLGNSFLYPLIDDCMVDRYKLEISSMGSLYSAMFKCFSDKEIFRKLYFARDFSMIDEGRVFVKLNDF